MAEAIGTTGDIPRTGVTTIDVTDTVITGNAAKAAHPIQRLNTPVPADLDSALKTRDAAG